MNWKDCVNQKLGPARISDLSLYIQPSRLPENYSAIDRFYSNTQELLKISTPDFLENNPLIGPLILVGFISATEDYFREVFSRLIYICPVEKENFTDRKVSIASAIWCGKNFMARAAFEDYSFASTNAITKTCKEYIGYDIICAKNEDSIFKEFDKICELRHCIVHSSSIMAGKNAIKLGLKNKKDKPIEISIDYPKIQECGLICTCLVTSVNLELFECIVTRWAVSWPKLLSWDPKDEYALFKKIWNLFHSEKDSKNNPIDCVPTLRKRMYLAKNSFRKKNPIK
ncbi:MAG: hypothetical protein ACYDEF_15510 [Methanosarcina sp.]